MRSTASLTALGALLVALAAGCSDSSSESSGDFGSDAAQDGGDATYDAQDGADTDLADDVAADQVDDIDLGPDLGIPPSGPDWYQDALFYEVFVRSFYDSDGDGIGDLQGLIEKLDYINDGRPGQGDDLEADGIWLMPIFESPSYHGYDTTDYFTVEPDYGTNDDLADLIAACETRDLRLVLDLVINHSSSQHPWFVDAGTGAGADYRDYYLWRDENPGWTRPWGPEPVWHDSGSEYYYGLFWGGMPDLNYRDPGLVTEVTELAEHWIDEGVAGFRIDAARYLVESETGALADQPETHTFFRELRADLAERDDESYLIGEVWTARSSVANYYGEGDELHQTFDFDLLGAIEQTFLSGQASYLADEMTALANSRAPWSFSGTFLGNHDIARVTTRFRSDWRQKGAAAVLLTLPGSPYIYYGDEISTLRGDESGDLANRQPMAWSRSANGGFTTGTPWAPLPPEWRQRNVSRMLGDPDSVLNHYRALSQLRRAHPTLRTGEVATVEADETGLFVMLRHDDEGAYLVTVNVSSETIDPSPLDLSDLESEVGEAAETPEVVFGETEESPSAEDLSAVTIGDPLEPGEARVIRMR